MPAALPIPMLAGIDNFWIIVAIIIGSAIWDWIRKKGQHEETGSSPGEPGPPRPRPPAAAPRPVATSDWEEELRRLLAGEPPVAKPPPNRPPPLRPVIVQESKPAPPSRPVMAAPPVARSARPPLAEAKMAEAERAVEIQLPALKESPTVYHRASYLHQGVAEHLKRVEEMTEHNVGIIPIVRRQSYSAETARTIALIRNPRTARHAVIASMIFGPPRALERE